MIAFMVPGTPVGKGRPRMTRSGHVYTPEATRCYELAIATVCRAAFGPSGPLAGPVRVEICVDKEIPASKTKRIKEQMRERKIRPTTKPDLDNVIKAVLDGCNGIAYFDDKQIVELECTAYYADEPRVYVKISEVG